MKIYNFIVKQKLLIILIFFIFLLVSLILIPKVDINYDLSKYLPADSTSTQDLEIISSEMTDVEIINIMVEQVQIDSVIEIQSILGKTNGIDVVIVDTSSKSNYIDDTVLFTVVLDQYGIDNIDLLTTSIKDELGEFQVSIDSEMLRSRRLQDSIQSELILILLVGTLIVLIILLFSTKTYIEPIAVLFVVGFAILINMGTNIIFSEISYVTQSTSAILQLGLSLDYSIILIHKYYSEKNKITSPQIAMKNALANSFKTIFSSSLTTVIGLLAMAFMSFTIGKDIGFVIAKGILISFITSMTLLPVVLLFIEKLKFNKEHKIIELPSKKNKEHSDKKSIIITAVTFIIIIIMFLLQTQNSFTFVEKQTNEEAQKINDIFGESNSMIIGIKNDAYALQNEQLIIDKITNEYGDYIRSYLGNSNTYYRSVTVDELSQYLTVNAARLIFSQYYLSENPDCLTEYPNYSITYSDYVTSLSNISDFVELPIDIKESIDTLITLKSIKDNNYNAYTMKKLLVSEMGIEFSDISSDNLNTLFNLYYLENDMIANPKIEMSEYLDTIELINYMKPMMFTDNKAIEEISSLNTYLKEVDNILSKEQSIEEFTQSVKTFFGIGINEEETQLIFNHYYQVNKILDTNKVKTEYIFNHIIEYSLMPTDNIVWLQGLLQMNTLYHQRLNYGEIDNSLSILISMASGEKRDIQIDEYVNKVIYVTTLESLREIIKEDINILEFTTYFSKLHAQRPDLIAGVDASTINILNQSNMILGLLTSDNEYTSEDMNYLLSTSDEEKMLNQVVYSLSLINNELLEDYSAQLVELTNYIVLQDNIELSDEQTKNLNDTSESLENMKNLVTTENMNIIILNTTLPSESDVTDEFIEYLQNDTLSLVDTDTYFAGSSVSDYEIKQYFSSDLLKINLITIIAIFIIIALTFKSFIIPLILVVIIEGAIWTNLSFSYIFGEKIFFIAYIIICAIQLGATIDYAILLTNNYRKNLTLFNSKNAMTAALKESRSTIITSGLILSIAGFTIAFISSQNSLQAIGMFLGRGTIISVLFILLILPHILRAFKHKIKKENKNEYKEQ